MLQTKARVVFGRSMIVGRFAAKANAFFLVIDYLPYLQPMNQVK